MKQIIKTILFKKRFKILKSKKGFSLLEVLIAVAIIGIISAIAVPQFAAQREDAARVASDTSAGNIIKAFQNCNILKGFEKCNELKEIGINCPANSTCNDETQGSNFCVDLMRGTAGQDDFRICVQMSSQASVLPKRTYGGTLLDSADQKVCQYGQVDDGGTCDTTTATVTPIKFCDNDSQCTSGATVQGTNCKHPGTITYTCGTVPTTGKCNTNGLCG